MRCVADPNNQSTRITFQLAVMSVHNSSNVFDSNMTATLHLRRDTTPPSEQSSPHLSPITSLSLFLPSSLCDTTRTLKYTRLLTPITATTIHLGCTNLGPCPSNLEVVGVCDATKG